MTEVPGGPRPWGRKELGTTERLGTQPTVSPSCEQRCGCRDRRSRVKMEAETGVRCPRGPGVTDCLELQEVSGRKQQARPLGL